MQTIAPEQQLLAAVTAASSFKLLALCHDQSMHGLPFLCWSCQSMLAENPAPEPTAADPIAVELAQLARSPITILRARWRVEFRSEPPRAFGPDLLRRSLAYRLQEEAYGKLPAATQRELDRLVSQIEKNPSARVVLPRRIKPGSVLVRDWKGQSHRVTVLDQGFGYNDRTYTSLSEIARAITGTRWNGPRFFGLRSERKADAQP